MKSKLDSLFRTLESLMDGLMSQRGKQESDDCERDNIFLLRLRLEHVFQKTLQAHAIGCCQGDGLYGGAAAGI